jgi:hypothetical protein
VFLDRKTFESMGTRSEARQEGSLSIGLVNVVFGPS